MRRVYVDMDGVLTDFVGAVCKLFNYNDAWPYGEYDICKVIGQSIWPQLDKDGYKFWSGLPKTEECDEIIALVSQFDYYICTAPTFDPQSAAGKLAWLRVFFPHAYRNRRYIITPHKYLLARPNAILIDDSDDQVDKWQEYCGQSHLIPRPWNKACGQCVSIEAIKEAITC